MKNKRKEFVAISDFHSYQYPLNKIKEYYLDEFDVIYILGDATDRGEYGDGTGGIKLLEEIKELTEKYPGRIIYIPGNHDEFIVGYAKGIENYKYNLIRNGGEKTIRDLENLKEQNPNSYHELINWLSKLPIQRIHKTETQNYVLAHALFNQKLYEYKPSYSLEDYFQEDNKKINKMVDNILWFRKGDSNSSCAASELPSSDSIMIIGHTPTRYRNGNLDLEAADGNMIKVYCVDGGIAYDGVMLKYISGASKPVSTDRYMHVSPTFEEEKVGETFEEKSEKNNELVTERFMKQKERKLLKKIKLQILLILLIATCGITAVISSGKKSKNTTQSTLYEVTEDNIKTIREVMNLNSDKTKYDDLIEENLENKLYNLQQYIILSNLLNKNNISKYKIDDERLKNTNLKSVDSIKILLDKYNESNDKEVLKELELQNVLLNKYITTDGYDIMAEALIYAFKIEFIDAYGFGEETSQSLLSEMVIPMKKEVFVSIFERPYITVGSNSIKVNKQMEKVLKRIYKLQNESEEEKNQSYKYNKATNNLLEESFEILEDLIEEDTSFGKIKIK